MIIGSTGATCWALLGRTTAALASLHSMASSVLPNSSDEMFSTEYLENCKDYPTLAIGLLAFFPIYSFHGLLSGVTHTRLICFFKNLSMIVFLSLNL